MEPLTLAFFESFVNPWMLLGLAGVSLPILAHLLSKKKYDVVQWGAMQFLELGKNTRRKIRLEELLLMLLRMALIALIVFALARPWVSGGLLGRLTSKRSRDVVLVIDGSYSMGWEGKAETPHTAAIQWAHDFLEELNAGDTVALLDARDVTRAVIESPTRDFGFVREKLNALPAPSGSSDLADATAKGIQILSRTSNVSREVIVLTDGQSRGWSARDSGLWARIDDLREQPTVEPRLWVVDVGKQTGKDPANFSLDRLEPSRELTVVGSPVRFRTKVYRTGGSGTVTRRVGFEVDGQRLAEKTVAVQLTAGGEATVEIEHTFTTHGSHVVAAVLDDDNLPGDNRAEAALSVQAGIPVLLVNGTPSFDPTEQETFFARAALTAFANEAPWIRSQVVDFDKWDADDLQGMQAVVLANVPRLSDTQIEALHTFVAGGGGLWIALGDAVDPAAYNDSLCGGASALMPVVLESVKSDDGNAGTAVQVLEESMELPWLQRLRTEKDGFTDARFSRWWQVQEATDENTEGTDTEETDEEVDAEQRPDMPTDGESEPAAPELGELITAVRLTNNDPLILTRSFGRGEVVLMTSPLDADWSTLPAKPDFVKLLHETVFYMAASPVKRNVHVGTSLLISLGEESEIEDWECIGPDEEPRSIDAVGDERYRLARCRATELPGRYVFRRKDSRAARRAAGGVAHFVVEFDRGESDLTRLTGEEQLILVKNDRMKFTNSLSEIREAMFRDESRSEYWFLLMFLLLGILVFEVVMTRRLVRGGHENVDIDSTAEIGQEPAASGTG